MKKILSLALSFVIILSFSVIAFAEDVNEQLPPENAPAECLMGDADGNSVLNADDARLILRTAVGLEDPDPETLLRCDIDFTGGIEASDARVALRMAVGLEKKVTHSFNVSEKQLPDCKNTGVIKACCAVCGVESTVVLKTAPHKYQNEEIKCEPEKLCLECGEVIVQEKLTHTLSEQGKCIYCDYVDAAFVYGIVVNFVKNNGELYEGIYCYQEDIPECSFVICYDLADKALYFMSGYYVETGTDIVECYTYLDVERNFAGYTAELDTYQNGEFAFYGIYNVAPEKLSLDTAEALSTRKVEPSNLDSVSREQIRLSCEANVIAIVAWANDLFERLDVPCNADIMGFTALDIEAIEF